MLWQKKQSTETPEVKKTEEQQSEPTLTEKYPQHIEAIQGSDEVWYNIPELGVRMRLNRGFAEDLVYVYSKSEVRATEDQKNTLFRLRRESIFPHIHFRRLNQLVFLVLDRLAKLSESPEILRTGRQQIIIISIVSFRILFLYLGFQLVKTIPILPCAC